MAEKAVDKKNLSGGHWPKIADRRGWPNHTNVRKLAPSFRNKLQNFLIALIKARATVKFATTLRPLERAWLMHHAWNVSIGKKPPTKDPHRTGIIWNHSDAGFTRLGAESMVRAFGIKSQPSLDSLHIKGRAIDMTIKWSGKLTIKMPKGEFVTIDKGTKDGSNKDLHKVGKAYGVTKLVSSKNHWSETGG